VRKGNGIVMTDLWLQLHAGLGDAIVLNGMIRTLAKTQRVNIPSYIHNLSSVMSMFMDVNVIIHPVRTHDEAVSIGKTFSNRLLTGYEGEGFYPTHFDRSFYEQAGMPFDLSWEAFGYVPSTNGPEVPKEPFWFVHSDSVRGFKIDLPPTDRLTYRPDGYPSVFDYAPLIIEAEEIHGTESCFTLLADRLPTKAIRKVCHRYSRPGADKPTYRNGWEIL
jgi:hypothetical protein